MTNNKAALQLIMTIAKTVYLPQFNEPTSAVGAVVNANEAVQSAIKLILNTPVIIESFQSKMSSDKES